MVIGTVLGSCVSVCIFCPDSKVGGMTHYGLPSPDFAGSLANLGRDPFRFGTLAITALIDEVRKLSNSPSPRLQAKITGGAAVVEGLVQGEKVGHLNIEIAEQLLRENNIPVIGRDVGGQFGRKVYFYTDTGRLRVSPLDQSYSKRVSLEKKTRVLIVDDSKTIQGLLKSIFSKDSSIEVIGTASDPVEARPLIEKLKPDVMTLDIHMPKMDGVTFLEQLLPDCPLPTVMITSISTEESNHVFRALELGAVDYVQKPSLNELPLLAPIICEKVKSAAKVRIRPRKQISSGNRKLLPNVISNRSTLIAIGASTGGTEALKEVLVLLPKEIPPLVIVQHIPPVFSTAFAKRLNELCPFEVKEAEDGDLVTCGRALIAPGGWQMAVEPSEKGLRVKVIDAAPVNRHKPSVDFLFDSVSQYVGKNSIGVILTGMGADGAKGLLRMRKTGARTIGQDEASSVVYGMPKAAVEIGAVEEVHSLENIADVLVSWLNKTKAA